MSLGLADGLGLDDITLIFGAVGGIAMMVYWHVHKETKFDLRYVLLDTTTDHVSLTKLGQLVALLSSTWVLIHSERANTLTEWQYGLYMASWTAVGVANKWLDRGKQPVPEEK